MTGLSSVYGPVGVNSKCGVQSKSRCESCICIAGFSARGCQKKSGVWDGVQTCSSSRRKVSRTRAIYSIETHTSDFIFNGYDLLVITSTDPSKTFLFGSVKPKYINKQTYDAIYSPLSLIFAMNFMFSVDVKHHLDQVHLISHPPTGFSYFISKTR